MNYILVSPKNASKIEGRYEFRYQLEGGLYGKPMEVIAEYLIKLDVKTSIYAGEDVGYVFLNNEFVTMVKLEIEDEK